MKREKLIRRLRFLIHSVDRFSYFTNEESIIEHLDKMINCNSGVFITRLSRKGKCYKEIKRLVIETDITKAEYLKIVAEEKALYYKSQDNLRLNNLKEGRDNKGVYVGNGGSNANKVRYPKKARSKRTWAIFYKMFPSRALKDGWDGEKSIKTM